MATAGWRTNSTVKTLVFRQYGSFNVFQLVRLLQWKRKHAGADAPLSAWPVDQRFRFRTDLSSAFPGREFSRLSVAQPVPLKKSDTVRRVVPASEVIEIRTPNYSVAGELGPLPAPFTDWVRDQERSRDHAMANFLDLFTQRLNVLRFQLKSRQTLGLNNLPPEDTPHALYLASLMGAGQPEIAAQIPLPRRAWLGLAGLLSNSRKTASTATHVLSLFLGARVTLEPFVGGWQDIESGDRIALGRSNHRLGQRSLLGRRVWDQQSRVRLRVAPLDYQRFCLLLPPDQSMHRRRQAPASDAMRFDGFLALLRLLLDRLCDCEVHLQIRSDTIPPSMLTAKPQRPGYLGLRLGQTAWLGNAYRNNHPPAADDVRKVAYLIRAFDAREAA